MGERKKEGGVLPGANPSSPQEAKASPHYDALCAAVVALNEIAHPAYGIGFRGLKQIAKRGLRDASRAMKNAEGSGHG